MQSPTNTRDANTQSTAALWLTGFAFAAIHIAFSWQYGFHRDELLSYSNAMHLDWCYVVYPPLTAWLARAELVAFGPSLMGYRLLPALSVGLVSVLAGLIARSMGAGRRAMVVAAVASGIMGPVAFAGCFLSYMSFDLLWWVLAAWAVVELIRTQNPRWWLAVGVAFGLGLLTKYTILAFAAGLLIGMLFTSNRRWFRSGWFWAGVAISLLFALPVVLWQFQHHFVALAWMKSIHTRDMSWGRTANFIPNQFWNVTSPITVPIWLAGLWFLFRTPEGKPYRIIGWMFMVTITLFTLARARDYYLAPAYPMLMAAGAAWGERWLSAKTPRLQIAVLRATTISLAIGAVAVLALTLPIAPIGSAWWMVANKTNQCFDSQLGWPQMVATLAQVRDSLPARQRATVAVMAADEGEAGAVNLYGPAYNLGQAISGMNSNWLRGYPDPPPQTVIAVGFWQSTLNNNFASCRVATHLSNPYGIVNQAIGDRIPVYVCTNIREPWPQFWSKFQYYG